MNAKLRRFLPLLISICLGMLLSFFEIFVSTGCDLSALKTSSIFIQLSKYKGSINGSFDEYEPRIIIDNDDLSKSNSQVAEKLRRPRYYSTELEIREKLFIAVLSSENMLSSFGIALNKTLSHYVNRLVFFTSGLNSKKLNLNIPLVSFKYDKPLFSFFNTLSYISQHFIKDYDYFFIIKDNTYIHGKKLVNLISKFSVIVDINMGALSDSESLYCSAESGILLSNSALQKVSKNLDWCSKNTYVGGSDTNNVGRCILRSVGMPCMSNMQGQRFVTYHLPDGVHAASHLQLIKGNSVIHEAVTITGFHTVKDLYAIHLFFLQDDLQKINYDIKLAQKEIITVMPLSAEIIKDTWPIGSFNSFKAPNRTFNETHIFLPNEHENIVIMEGANEADIMNVLNASISHMHSKTKGLLEFQKLDFGHRRYDPERGVDYIFTLTFKDITTGLTVSKKVEAMYSVTYPEIISVPYVTENVRITIVTKVQENEIPEALSFYRRFYNDIKDGQAFVMFVFIYNSENSPTKGFYDVYKSFKAELMKDHDSLTSVSGWISVRTANQEPSDFAVVDLVARKFRNDTLIFKTDLSAHLSLEFLNRIRMNTIINWQIFNPIPYVLYHPSVVDDSTSYEKMYVVKGIGHFDRFNYDHVSFFIQDYIIARKKVEEVIPIMVSDREIRHKDINKKDFRICGMFLRAVDINVLRAAEPSLKLPYKGVICDNGFSTKSKQTCRVRQSESVGLASQLSHLVAHYDKKKKVGLN